MPAKYECSVALYLPYISTTSPPYLPHISPVSPAPAKYECSVARAQSPLPSYLVRGRVRVRVRVGVGVRVRVAAPLVPAVLGVGGAARRLELGGEG